MRTKIYPPFTYDISQSIFLVLLVVLEEEITPTPRELEVELPALEPVLPVASVHPTLPVIGVILD